MIEKKEKKILFKRIVKDSLSLDESELDSFLDRIPSYPMDIIVAANSLISSELLYDEYLSRIYIKNKEYIPATKDNLLNVRYQVLG